VFLLSAFAVRQSRAEESINLQGYYFSDAFRYAVLEDSGLIRFPGSYVLTTSLAYVNVPLVVSDAASDTKLVDFLDHFWIGTVGFTYHFNSVISLGIDVPYLMTEYSQDQPNNYGYPNSQGDQVSALGDITLRAKLRIYRDTKSKIGLAFIPKLDLPTGNAEGFSTDDSARISGLLVFEKYWDRLSVLLSGGFSTSSSAIYRDVDYRTLLPFGVGLSWRLDNTWNLNLESNRQIALKGGDKQDSGDYYLTLKGKVFSFGSFYTGAGIAGINDVDQDNWTLFAGLKFHPYAEEKKVDDKPITPVIPEEPVVAQEVNPEPVPVVLQRDQEKLLGDLFKADRVYFDNSKTVIKPSEAKKLDAVVDNLINYEGRISKVIIEGYASKVGTKKHNEELSINRSENVYQYLVRKGVAGNLLQKVHYGDDYLNEEPEHWMNRRVEFRIYMKKSN
jgi:outer membrane protein OmpA-like peptidoglycan-associated protein